MEELIRQVLEQYFSDFKDYHIWILILFTVIIALLQVIQSIIIARKIKSFKNKLRRSEIKFSRYNQIQIEALSEVFGLFVELKVNTGLVSDNINSASPELLAKYV